MADDFIRRGDAIDAALEQLPVCFEMDAVESALMNVPAADVRPMVHAYWKGFCHSAYHGQDEWDEPILRDVIVWHCSNCNRRTVIKENFCPNCGAMMEVTPNG